MLFLSDYNETVILMADLKILKYQISLKSILWEPGCSRQTDGWTDRHDEANNRSLQFSECAKTGSHA